MTGFVVIAAILLAASLAWVLRPLWRRDSARTGIARDASNLALLRQQLAELETDRAANTLTAEQYQQAKAEIERRVLDEAQGGAADAPAAPRRRRWTAATLALLVPALAVGLYLRLGGIVAFAPQPTAGEEQAVTREQVEAMVARLAARLKEEPDNAEGWNMLARSYVVMQRYPEAVTAYAKLLELVPDNANVMADYAEVLAMAQGRRLAGKPMELVHAALKIDPNQWKALVMAGTEAFDRQDYKQAIMYWEHLARTVPPQSELAKSVEENIAEARERAGIKPSATGARPASVRGTVSLSPALAGKAKPSDTVFIFARAAGGPRMPLAILKRQVKDLPAPFTLDDTQAMAPGMTLSRFTEVVIAARITRSAEATARSGDLQGQSAPVKVGATDVAVVIDRVVP